jgi:putative ABC transport system permease protein
MNGLLQDFRYALRQMRKSPGFTAVAVLTLSLGIGANTGIFTLVNAVMLKSLPVSNPEQLYLLTEGDFQPANTRFAYPTFQRGRAAMPHGSSLAAASWPGRFYASFAGGEAEMATGQLVSGNYFSTLGTYSEKGRLLTENDDREIAGSPVAVISYACWERRFGRAPNVLGQKLTVSGMPLQIVGVAARGFFGAQVGAAPEFWLPTAMQSGVRYQQHYSQDTDAKTDAPWVLQPDIRWLQFITRISNPKLVAQTSAALNQIFHSELVQAATQEKDPSEREAILRARLSLIPGARGLPNLRNTFSQPLLALMAMVGIILVITCANLANLLLARAAAREREIAVRLSIGATRPRLVRQLLVECVLLSAMGAVFGSAVAYWVSGVLPKWISSSTAPAPLSLGPDGRVLLFGAAVAVLTGIAFGLAPAVQGTRVEPIHALKSGGLSTSGTASRWLVKQILVTVQIALSLMLLVGAGLFVRTLRNYSILDPGFDRDHLVTIDLDTHLAGYSQPQLTALYKNLIDRVEAIPGIRSASLLNCEIASGCGDASDIFLPGVPHTNGETDAQERFVSNEFFATTAIPLIEGRMFAESDTENTPKVVVVNETFVRQFLAGKDPIGQYYGYDARNPHVFQIVGVVKDARVNDAREEVPPTIFHSLRQDPIDVGSLNVRTFGPPGPLVAQIRVATRSVDPHLPMGLSSTVAEVADEGLWSCRLIAKLASIFGGLALGLACLGLYGVMSYSVARRTAELGIRVALGASRTNVVSLILNSVLIVIGAGVLIGLALSFATVRAVSSLLFGISPYDPATMIGAAALLTIVALTAGLKPAWRAAHVDPIAALRVE